MPTGYAAGCSNECNVAIYYKDVISSQDYYIDWRNFLREDDYITQSVWEMDSDGLIVVQTEDIGTVIESQVARIRLSGGVAGDQYQVCNTIESYDGVKARRCFKIIAYECSGLTPWDYVRVRAINEGQHDISAHIQVTDANLSANVPGSHAGTATIKWIQVFLQAENEASHTMTVASPVPNNSLSVIGYGTHHIWATPTGIDIGLSANVQSSHSIQADPSATTPIPIGDLNVQNISRHNGTAVPFVFSPNIYANLEASHTASVRGRLTFDFIQATNYGHHGMLVRQPTPTDKLQVTGQGTHHILATPTATDPPPQPPPSSDQPWMGVGVDPVTNETQFAATAAIANVSSTAQLFAVLAQVRSDPMLYDEIHLDPGTYVWGEGNGLALQGLIRNQPKTHPLVIRTKPGSGSNRAKIESFAIRHFSGDGEIHGLALVDLRLVLHDPYYDNRYGGASMYLFDGGSNILIEKCDYFGDIQGGRLPGNQDDDVTKPVLNVCLRFNTMFGNGQHDQGNGHRHALYETNCEIKMDYNFIWHCGWPRYDGSGNPTDRSTFPSNNGGPSMFSHNIYHQKLHPTRPGIFRYNWIGQAASHGIHMRAGGVCHHNIFSGNGIGLQCGMGADGKDKWGYSYGQYPNYPTALGQGIHHNFFVDSEDINTNPATLLRRGNAITIEMLKDCEIHHNYMGVNRGINPSNSGGSPLKVTGPSWPPGPDIHVHHNYSHDWKTSLAWQPGTDLTQWNYHDNHWDDPAITFNDPDRLQLYNYATVAETLMLAGGVTKAWMDAALADCEDAMQLV